MANRHHYPGTGWQHNLPIHNYNPDEEYDQSESSRGFQDYDNSLNQLDSQYETPEIPLWEQSGLLSSDTPHWRRPQHPGRATSERTDLEAPLGVVNLREENENLKVLLRDVQQEKLSALDDFQPRSDADLREEMVELQYQITSFSRHLRSSKANSDGTRTSLGDDATLTVPMGNISAIYFFESFLWKQLIVELFDHPFKAFGSDGEKIRETWCLIFDREGSNDFPGASEASERWKSITVKHLLEKVTQAEREQQLKRITQSVLDRFQYLAPALHGALRGGQFKKLVAKGWDVATTFAQQRCHLRLTFPEDVLSIDDESVEVVEEVSHWPAFVFSVSPALLKLGNGYGQDFEDHLCLVKAKVIRSN